MQETINLLHQTIDNERTELIRCDYLKEDLLNQILGLQSQQNLRKEKVEKLESELKNLYDQRKPNLEPSMGCQENHAKLSGRNKNVGQPMNAYND